MTELMILELEGELVLAKEARAKKEIAKEKLAKKAAEQASEQDAEGERQTRLALEYKAQYENTLSPIDIARAIGISEQTAFKWHRRLKNDPNYAPDFSNKQIRYTEDQWLNTLPMMKAYIALETVKQAAERIGCRWLALKNFMSGHSKLIGMSTATRQRAAAATFRAKNNSNKGKKSYAHRN